MSNRQTNAGSRDPGSTVLATERDSHARIAEYDWHELVGRLETVIDRMRSGCVILDADSRIAGWNMAARLMFGLETEHVLGRSPGGLLVPERAWADFEGVFRQAGAAGLSTTALLGGSTTRGGRGPACEWRMVALKRPDGVVVGYTAMVGENSHGADRESSVAVEEDPAWEKVFDQMPVPTFLLSEEKKVVRANQAARVLFTRSSGSIEGGTLGELLTCLGGVAGEPPGGREPEPALGDLGDVLREAGDRGETVSRREVRHTITGPEGSRDAQLTVSASPVRCGGRNLILVSLEGFAERPRSDDQLHGQAMLVAAAEYAICIVGFGGNIVYWSPGAARLYGWTASEVIERPVSEVLFDGASYLWSGLRGLVVEKGSWEGDLEPFTRTKDRLNIRARAWMMPGGVGKESSIVLVATDLTRTRRLEKQLLRAQRLESVGTLTCGIAHDLNNVLTPVQMAAELLRPSVVGTDGERFLNLLVRSALRGVEITRQLLLYGRGGEGGKHGAVDLRSLLKETVKILASTIPKSIQVRNDIPEGIWPVVGDPTQIHQILLNLCVNARDAMPDGGTLAVTAGNRELDEAQAEAVTGGRPGRFVMLSVRDTGTGIPRELMGRIFDPFFTTKPPEMGSGLGLSTVQTLVRGHHGFISVATEEGRGSEFSVYFPAADAPSLPESASVAAVTSIPTANGEWILLVESDDSIRELMEAALEGAGLRVLTAIDGADGISVFGRHHERIVAVILDMMLPLIDGAAAIRVFRKLRPGVGIVAMSGLPSMREVASDAADGRVTFLQKPIEVGRLLEAVGVAVKG